MSDTIFAMALSHTIRPRMIQHVLDIAREDFAPTLIHCCVRERDSISPATDGNHDGDAFSKLRPRFIDRREE